MRRCALCRTTRNLERHHLVFGRGLRPLSEKYGLVKDLCMACHYKVHHEKRYMDWSRQTGQKMFEKDHSRDEFIQTFGKNYLD